MLGRLLINGLALSAPGLERTIFVEVSPEAYDGVGDNGRVNEMVISQTEEGAAR